VERIEFVEKLMAQMTVEEKVGQMTQLTLDVITQGDNIHSSYEPLLLNVDSVRKAIVQYHVGSVLNTANNRARTIEKWQEVVGSIQELALEETRLGIPVIYGIDAIHGATYTAGATMFPQQIAQAASWNRSLVKEAASITAYEVRASSIPWNFSPVLDLGIDPRWPRHWETFGEDPFLCAEMGAQVVDGYQGNDLDGTTSVAACLKHFLGYSASSSGKDRTPAYMPEEVLREYHLASFKKSIDAGAASIMINSGLINGIPVHANYNILTKLLKEELGFEGLVVSDWMDIENIHKRDKVATSHKEAIKMAINAGVDMSMVPYNYTRYCTLLTELVKEGEVSMYRIDDAVRRILNLKYKLGLFNPSSGNCNNYPKFGSKEYEKAAYQTAAEAITLLKNENDILPFSKESGQKILVCGPNANSMRTLNGGWTYSWQGEKTEEFAGQYNTILEAIRKEFGDQQVLYHPGVEYNWHGSYSDLKNEDLEGAVKAAKQADVVVLCLGENSYTEKPGDLHDLTIAREQQDLALALSETGKPIILVLNEGRPRIISEFANKMEAIVQVYLPGNFGGDALADILSGDVNPSGKLPYTYPMFVHSLGVYNHKPSEESKTAEGMYDYGGGFYPQFEFGHGLSYTTFEYSNLQVSQTEFSRKDELTVSVNVKNTGRRSGKEVVQLYSSDLFASLTPDVKRLRRFEKIELFPGEEKQVSFSLSAKDLAFVNQDGTWTAEKGAFELSIKHLKTKITLLNSVLY
jgi:beta-glucosidase